MSDNFAPDFTPSPEMLNGCAVPTKEEVHDFELYCSSHTSSFNVLGAKQYTEGQVVKFDDPDLQEWLDKRIEYAKEKRIKIVQPVECLINQSSLGSCSGASATGAQMCAIYNQRYFGIPALHTRLNCSVAYLKARGSWGSGLSVSAMQKTLMQFGNASVASAGEYSTRSPGKTTGFDNTDFQVWTCNCANRSQVTKFLQAGVPVAFGSSTMPQSVRQGRASGWRGASHAMQFSGYNHDTADPFFGLYLWMNSWGGIYDNPDTKWGCWMDEKEIDRFSMFGRYGLPYAIIGAEYKVGIN